MYFCTIFYSGVLQQSDTCLFTALLGLFVPDARLYLADVGASHHQHTESGLTDTAADGEG